MKKYTIYKTIQLVIFIVLAVLIALVIFPNADLYHKIAADPSMKILAAALWAALGISFVFIYIDFHFFLSYRKDYHEMEYALHSDPVTGLANRFACDMLIDQYVGRDLPKNMGCVILDLTNIKDINAQYGHKAGNIAIREFSSILRSSAKGLCFIGRNGGNRFLAIFENSSKDEMLKLIKLVNKNVQSHNSNSKNTSISFSYGISYSNDEKDAKDITSLISIAASRVAK